MTNQLPAEGDKNWGDTLNNWLGQLGPASLGGIHNGDTASRPAGLTADDEGRVYVDTESQEILRWDGSAWQTLLTGNVEQKFNITAKTADYTITPAEAETGLNGFSNDGATGTVKFTLPDAVAGMKVTIINVEGSEVSVYTQSGDTIHTTDFPDGVEYLRNREIAGVIVLYASVDGKWVGDCNGSAWMQLFLIYSEDNESGILSSGWVKSGSSPSAYTMTIDNTVSKVGSYSRKLHIGNISGNTYIKHDRDISINHTSGKMELFIRKNKIPNDDISWTIEDDNTASFFSLDLNRDPPHDSDRSLHIRVVGFEHDTNYKIPNNEWHRFVVYFRGVNSSYEVYNEAGTLVASRSNVDLSTLLNITTEYYATNLTNYNCDVWTDDVKFWE